MKRALLILLAVASLGLTPTERQAVVKARTYIVQAQAKAKDQEKVIQDENAENAKLDQIAQGQQNQITSLSDEIDKAHKNEVALAQYNAKAKVIIDQVNKWWGLGAFVYGVKVLFRHLLILAIVGAVLGVGIAVLSFFFPVIGVFLKAALAFITGIIKKFGGKK